MCNNQLPLLYMDCYQGIWFVFNIKPDIDITNKLYKNVFKKEQLEVANWLLDIKPGVDIEVLENNTV